MNTRTLRMAVAQFCPSMYNRWTWRKLLPDFVDMHVQAHLIRRDRHQASGETSPLVVSPLLKPAARMLAREEGHTYDYLAVCYYVLQHEVAAITKENEQLRQQLADMGNVAESSIDLADRAVTELDRTVIEIKKLTDPDPDRRPN